MIVLQETALIKGCEHAYCVTCILRWATYKEKATCPQCKHPFESLDVHRSLDGSIHDYLHEESVCLLLRAPWFDPLIVEHAEDDDDEVFDYYLYEGQYDDDNEDELNEMYLHRSPNLRIGNRRWGDNGYVRAGRQEARPVVSRQHSSAGPSHERKSKGNSVVKDAAVGRRAKRALKREAADKAAAAKHEKHLVRFGRN